MKKFSFFLGLLGVMLTSRVEAQGVPVKSGDFSVQVSAKEQSQLAAPMNGRLDTFPFHDGDVFHKGAILAHYHCDMQKAQLEKANAMVIKTQQLYRLHVKARQLEQYSLASEYEAKANLDMALADVEAARTSVNDCVVSAPYDGVVGSVSVHNYQFTQIGTPLLEILSLSNVEVSAMIPTRELPMVKDKTLTVHINETGKDYPVSFTRISGKFDPVSRTVRVYGVFSGDSHDIRPGMTGAVTVH